MTKNDKVIVTSDGAPGLAVSIALRSRALRIAIILVAGFIAYSNTFGAPFYLDDGYVIENPRVRDIRNIPSMFVKPDGPVASRPLLNASIALNFLISGENTWSYHALNLGFHLLNSVLLFLLISMIGRSVGHEDRKVQFVAIFSALIFAVHPVQTSAVTYIVSRSILFAASLYMLGIMLFHKAAISERHKAPFIAGLLATAFLGVSAREDFVTFPLMLIIYDYFFLSRFSARNVVRHAYIHVPVALSYLYLGYLVASYSHGSSAGFDMKAITPYEYLLTQFNVHWTYLRLIVLPVGQNLDYDYPVANTLFQPRTILSFFGYAALWVFAVTSAKRKPLLSFLLLWFLITLAPTSSIMPIRDVIFEYRLYMASIGIIVAAVIGISYLNDKLQLIRPAYGEAMVIAVSLIVVAFCAAAYDRNSLWTDGVAMWSDVIMKSPDKSRGYNNRGEFYMELEKLDLAIKDFETAVERKPTNWKAHHNAAVAYGKLGSDAANEKAFQHYISALKVKPDLLEAHNNVGIIYFSRGNHEKALEHFGATIKLQPDYATGYFLVGAVYLVQNRLAESEKALNTALTLDPGHWKSHKALGDLFMQKGNARVALMHYEKTLKINPQTAGIQSRIDKAASMLRGRKNAVSN